MPMKRNIARTALVAVAVAAATAVAAGAAQADPQADGRTHHKPGMERMHELHMQGNPGMQRMHQMSMGPGSR
jgi:hypothetical protein